MLCCTQHTFESRALGRKPRAPSRKPTRPRLHGAGRRLPAPVNLYYFAGVYQIGEAQARSWTVMGTSGDIVMPNRAAS